HQGRDGSSAHLVIPRPWSLNGCGYAWRVPREALCGPPDPRPPIPSPREPEPPTLEPRPERSVHRGIENLGAQTLELPTPLPENFARAEVGDAAKRGALLGFVSHQTACAHRRGWRARRRHLRRVEALDEGSLVVGLNVVVEIAGVSASHGAPH